MGRRARSREIVRRRSPVSLAAILAVLGLVAGIAACGRSSTLQPPVSRATLPPSSTSSTTPPAPTTLDDLEYLAVREADLGTQWTNLGVIPTSLDVTNPPKSCALYAAVFDNSPAILITGYSYLLTPTGDESGHLFDTGIATTRAQAEREISLIASGKYRQCAEDTADQLALNGGNSVMSSNAQRLPLRVDVPAAGWRVVVETGPSPETFYVDIVYMASGPFLEKVRVLRCPCSTSSITPTELEPGELSALTGLAQRLEGGASLAVVLHYAS